MLKVISFSLWGNNPKYTIGAIRNAELALKIYPDWECHFFVGGCTDFSIINRLLNFKNTIVHRKQEDGNWESMFWRFQTSYDPNINVSIFRDTDSRLNFREKAAVEDWLSSDKTFHIMRDHPYHRFPILGGMWGMKHNPTYDMKLLLANFEKKNSYGTDYDFFIQKLYPLINDDKLVHDPFFDKIPFPTPRENNEFVGDVFDENNIRHPEYWKHIK